MVNQTPEHDHSLDPEEPQPGDTGTFTAKPPTEGGFLGPDGPYDIGLLNGEQATELPAIQPLPFDEVEDEDHNHPFVTALITMLIVSGIALALATLLVWSLGNDSLGTAGDLISVLRTTLH